MTKRVFVYTFLVIFVVVFILVSLYYSIFLCNNFYMSDLNDIGELSAAPDGMNVLPGGDLILYGSCDYGTKKDKSFYKVYNEEGKLLTHTTLGTDGRRVVITGISVDENRLIFTCMDTSTTDYLDVRCELYMIDSEYNVAQKILLETKHEQDAYYNVMPVDGTSDMFACVSTAYVDIFSADGQLAYQLPIENVAKVMCVSLADGMFVIGGSLASDELLDSFTNAFIAAYDIGCTKIWQNVYCEKLNQVSTIVSVKHTGNGNVIAYGRYIDYSMNLEEGSSVTELSVDEFYRMTYYGNPTEFEIITPDGVKDYTLKASVFLQTVNRNGEDIKNIDYNVFEDYAVPMPVNVLFSENTEFIVMTSYSLVAYKTQTYNIDISILDSQLNTVNEYTIVPNDRTQMLFTMDEEQNIYGYYSLGGTNKHTVRNFGGVETLIEEFEIINIAMIVRDVFARIQEIVDLIFIGVLVFFTQSIKACRRI